MILGLTVARFALTWNRFERYGITGLTMNMHSRVEVIPKVRPLEDLTVTDPGSCPPHMQTKKRGKEKGKK